MRADREAPRSALAPLLVKPERLAERIVQAVSEPDARAALLLMTELQAETVASPVRRAERRPARAPAHAEAG